MRPRASCLLCVCVTATSVLGGPSVRTMRRGILQQLPPHPARAGRTRRAAVHLQRLRCAVPQRRQAAWARDRTTHGAQAAPVPTLRRRVRSILFPVAPPPTVSWRETRAGHDAAGIRHGIPGVRNIHHWQPSPACSCGCRCRCTCLLTTSVHRETHAMTSWGFPLGITSGWYCWIFRRGKHLPWSYVKLPLAMS